NNLRLLSTDTNSGAGTARNIGVKAAKGNFIALLDSDDVMHPKHLEISINMLKSNINANFSYSAVGDMESMNEDMSPPDNLWVIGEKFIKHPRPYLFDLHFGTSSGIVFRKEIFDKIGFFDGRMRAAEDTDFFIRASELGLGLPVNKTLVFKDHKSKDRLTSNYVENAKAYDIIINKNLNYIFANSFLMKKWLYKSIWLNFYAGNKKQAVKYLLKLFGKGIFLPKGILITVFGLVLSSSKFVRLHKYLSGKK
ncbi:glycosyltransferase family 2 protein, partial [Fulvivirga lutimaris]|uniref:glycosyltransferase family 2 protein n=1 Tax=Fulvivirga lutimaris TaxID=1819566 RepID=UPI0012BBAE62